MKPTGHSAVMNQRASIPDGLDDFPTPPWAARALEAHVLPELGLSLKGRTVLEPAANRGIMAACFREAGARVFASDVHAYPDGDPLDEVASYIGGGGLLDDVLAPRADDIVATNPPFNLALEFALRAISEARAAVALLCRSNWAEGIERYQRLFKPYPPTLIAQFVERVPMTEGSAHQVLVDINGEAVRVRRNSHRGGYDPEASTATAYAWFVWVHKQRPSSWGDPPELDWTHTIWIPPCREALTQPDDAARFGKIKEPPHA